MNAKLAWTWAGSPGDVVAARPGPAGGRDGLLDVAVLTAARELWLRRIEGTSARWESRGPVPTDVLGPSLVAVLEPGPAAHPLVAVGAVDSPSWVSRRIQGRPRWDALTTVASSRAALAPAWVAGTGERMLLVSVGEHPRLGVVATASTGALLCGVGEAPDVPAGIDLESSAVLVTAEAQEGLAPVVHVVASVYDLVREETRLRIGFPDGPDDGSGARWWTWIDPGPPPAGGLADLRDATSVASASGEEACVVFGPSPSDGPVRLLRGGGRTWRWEDLGRPPGAEVVEPRVVSTSPEPGDPGGGRAPWVLVTDERLAGHRWTPGEGWAPTERLPAGAWLPPGGAAAARAGEPWLAGIAGAGDLWVCPPSAAPEVHLRPQRIVDVVGVLHAPHAEARDRPVVLDHTGGLWSWEESGWVDHGRPGGTAIARLVAGSAVESDGAGMPVSSAVVVDEQDHVWERRQRPRADGAAGDVDEWLDHGPPPLGEVDDVARPIQTGAPAIVVPVLTRDGRIRTVDTTTSPPSWTDRGQPSGRDRIFGLVGAAPVTRGSDDTIAVTVVTSDGTLWVHAPGPGWTSLGSPGKTIAGGLGVVRTRRRGTARLRSVVADSDGGVWTCAWPGGVWAELGRPPGDRITGAGSASEGPRDAPTVAVRDEGGRLWVGRISMDGTFVWLPGERPPTASGAVPVSRVRVSPSWSGTAAVDVVADERLWMVRIEDGEP